MPWILENALHAGLMLTGALITGLAALQHGDRATVREFTQRYGLPDPRAHNARDTNGSARVIGQALEMLNPRRLSRAQIVYVLCAVALLVFAATALVLYNIIADVVRRPAAGKPRRDDKGAVRHSELHI